MMVFVALIRYGGWMDGRCVYLRESADLLWASRDTYTGCTSGSVPFASTTTWLVSEPCALRLAKITVEL